MRGGLTLVFLTTAAWFLVRSASSGNVCIVCRRSECCGAAFDWKQWRTLFGVGRDVVPNLSGRRCLLDENLPMVWMIRRHLGLLSLVLSHESLMKNWGALIKHLSLDRA